MKRLLIIFFSFFLILACKKGEEVPDDIIVLEFEPLNIEYYPYFLFKESESYWVYESNDTTMLASRDSVYLTEVNFIPEEDGYSNICVNNRGGYFVSEGELKKGAFIYKRGNVFELKYLNFREFTSNKEQYTEIINEWIAGTSYTRIKECCLDEGGFKYDYSRATEAIARLDGKMTYYSKLPFDNVISEENFRCGPAELEAPYHEKVSEYLLDDTTYTDVLIFTQNQKYSYNSRVSYPYDDIDEIKNADEGYEYIQSEYVYAKNVGLIYWKWTMDDGTEVSRKLVKYKVKPYSGV